MHVTTVGLDLAKTIFHVHGVREDGEVAFNRPLRRAQVLAFFQRLAPCLIGIEACASGHYWARELTRLGHQVRLMPPMYVKPYVKRGKSDGEMGPWPRWGRVSPVERCGSDLRSRDPAHDALR